MMSSDYSPQSELFSRRTAAAAYLAAVQELCEKTSRTWDQMEQLTLHEIFEIAETVFGTSLPEFWEVWKDWHENDKIQPMGDL